jgi:hypothetical protein
MSNATMKSTIALALGGAMFLAAAPQLLAAPVTLNSAAVTAAVPNDVIDVRYRGRGRGGRGFGPGAAVALGAVGVMGAIVANGIQQQSYGYYGYGPGYEQSYDQPLYAPAYGPRYAPAYGYRQY